MQTFHTFVTASREATDGLDADERVEQNIEHMVHSPNFRSSSYIPAPRIVHAAQEEVFLMTLLVSHPAESLALNLALDSACLAARLMPRWHQTRRPQDGEVSRAHQGG